ncbi:hypothetical protein L1F30_14940 [Simiduia sp. 21SJ11W-1]|uniref:hypothetical protein n=1 Tax=Simiduia sp. 21SJ11W-1 TaxID=2909669 RepID=UPI00209E8994|nr:hypothetical protein [Simiduia sp. 21SJ11W-1]UTA47443.1 hypothetical protein L1F30_14940 [Simiduia sp. 21SJ11W-1]
MEYTVKIVAQLCNEEEIPIYWYFTSPQWAETVKLHQIPTPTETGNNQGVKQFLEIQNIYGDVSNNPDTQLEGYKYQIALKYSQRFREYLAYLATGIPAKDAIDGMIVKDDQGSLYRPVIQHCQRDGDHWIPAGFVDAEERFVIRAEDLDDFVQKALKEQPSDITNDSPTLLAHPVSDTAHAYYAPDLHIALNLWDSCYRQGTADLSLTHTKIAQMWLKNNHPNLSETTTKRITLITTPAQRKNDGRFKEK